MKPCKVVWMYGQLHPLRTGTLLHQLGWDTELADKYPQLLRLQHSPGARPPEPQVFKEKPYLLKVIWGPHCKGMCKEIFAQKIPDHHHKIFQVFGPDFWGVVFHWRVDGSIDEKEVKPSHGISPRETNKQVSLLFPVPCQRELRLFQHFLALTCCWMACKISEDWKLLRASKQNFTINYTHHSWL